MRRLHTRHSTPSPWGLSSRLARALLLPLLLACLPAAAIVIRHDQADSRYVVEDAAYPQVFSLHRSFDNRVCVATLISPRWAITAAHCTDQTPIGETLARRDTWPLVIAGRSYRVEALVIHPGYRKGEHLNKVDLALLRLDREVSGVPPARLYREADEQGKPLLLLGWGFSGIGTVGRSGNDGRLRRAYNRVQEAGRFLTFRFDDPREAGQRPLPLEGVPGLGDSGGPALLETGSGLAILGVALGELVDPEAPEAPQGLYGAIEIYERISSHLQWIESHVRGS